ncbi:MAG TPA: hypothetical protein VL354_00750 [Spirochaetia bacterium]|nr:hypothetical protein [Spirochaetia bacterium]
MRARPFATFILLVVAASAASAEINLGAGATYELGNSPISQVIPEVFAEMIYHVRTWETFGIDFLIGSAPASAASYTKGLSAGPEVLFGTDLSYHFPRVGPADFSVLVGVVGFQDYENRANGVAAQTGLATSLHFGSFFVQGRCLSRFYSSTGMSGAPLPVGGLSLGILGGYSLL